MEGRGPAPAGVVLLGLLAVSPVPGFPAARYDERLFHTALSLLRNDEPEQALKTFEELSRDFPESPLADDALYRSGAYFYPAEGIEDLHEADRTSLSRAAPFFRRVQEHYSRSDMGPRALFKLGLMALEARNPERSLEDAFARFFRILTLYPDSPVVDRALLGAGFTQARMGAWDRAMDYLDDLLARFPESPAVPRAMFLLATCQAFRGQDVAAMETLQALLDRDEEAPVGIRARQFLTLIYRTRFLPGLGREVPFRRDAVFQASTARAGIRSCSDLAVDGDGRVYISDSRQGLLWSFRPDGSLLGRLSRAEGIQWIAVREGHGVLTGSRESIYLGNRVKTVMRGKDPLRDIESVAISEEGEIYLVEGKEREVLLLKGSLEFESSLYRASTGRPLTVRLGPVGTPLVLLSPPALLLREPTGDWREVLRGEDILGSRAGDFDVDRLGNLYVLAGRTGEVFLYRPTGELLTRLQAGTPAGEPRFLPSALAVDGAGSLYLCSRKGGGVARYR